MLTEGIIRKMEFYIRMPYKIAEIAKYSNLLRCKRQWLRPMLTVGVLTTTFKDRQVTIQFECARLNVGSNMLFNVVITYKVWYINYLGIVIT